MTESEFEFRFLFIQSLHLSLSPPKTSSLGSYTTHLVQSHSPPLSPLGTSTISNRSFSEVQMVVSHFSFPNPSSFVQTLTLFLVVHLWNLKGHSKLHLWSLWLQTQQIMSSSHWILQQTSVINPGTLSLQIQDAHSPGRQPLPADSSIVKEKNHTCCSS